MNNATEKVIAQVGFRYEADAAVAAIEDAGMAAYARQTPSDNLLVMPGIIGVSENGYDIVVRIEDADKALDVLNGIGYGKTEEESGDAPQDTDSNDETAEDIIEVKGETMTSDIDTVEESTEKSAEMSPQRERFTNIVLTVFALIAIAGVVWLTDFVVELFKGLVSCS